MVSIEEAQELMITFIQLRDASNKTKAERDIEVFRNHENLCIEKFSYLVSMRTRRYRSFPNYEDLNQEGFEMLLRAMNNYNPKKGNFFWWAHKYIDTRIARSANTHTVIRYPLKFARIHTPHRETKLPIMSENKNIPDKLTEHAEVANIIQDAMGELNNEQKQVVQLAFGFNGDKPMSVSGICRKLNVSRFHCMKIIDNALGVLKQNIRL
jgi:RNA polymerase sigma factor (sigma-70 family)